MSLAPSRSPGLRRRLIALGVVGSVGWVLLASFVPRLEFSAAFRLPWWGIATAFVVSDLAAVHVRAGDSSWRVRLDEVPLVLGLFFLSPLALLVARLVGSVGAIAVRRRRQLPDSVADLVRVTAACAAAVAVFRLVVASGNPLGAVGWVGALSATVVSLLVTNLLVPERRTSGTEVRHFLWVPLAVGAASLFETSVALLAVDHLGKDRNDLWLIVLSVMVLWVALRGLARQQEKQQLLGLLFEQGALGVVLIDRDLRLANANETASDIVGKPKDRLIGQLLGAFVHPEDLDDVLRDTRAILDGTSSTTTREFRLVTGDDGAVIADATMSPVRDDQGRVEACLMVFDDVTAQRAMQERSRRTEERIREGVLRMTVAREPRMVLQAVVDLAREVVDAEYAALGVLREGSPSLSDFLFSGIDEAASERIGEHPAGLGLLGAVTRSTTPIRLTDLTMHRESQGFPPAHPAMRSFLGVPIIYEGTPLGNLYLADKVGGGEFFSEDEALLLAFAAQAAVVIQNARMHETEQRLIDRLDRSNVELKKASRARSVFLATMSHDLRTPLNAMLLAADILRDPAYQISEERGRELASNIATSGRHLLGLIDDLLDLSRIEAGHFDVRPEPTALDPLLMDSAEGVERLASDKAIRLELPSPDGIWVKADPIRARQAMLNLLSNALKFTDPEGRVWIEVEASGAEVAIAVCDTGKGIAPEDLERIFQPFEQGDTYAVGTGLGLAIARSIAQAHGGRLDVTSDLGGGSRFVLTLPRSTPLTPSIPSQPTLLEAVEDRRLTIQIVEDDPSARQLSLEILSTAGYRVVGSGTLAEATAAVDRSRPDLILLDIRLGDEDGLDLVRRLRGRSQTRTIPIVAVSASTSKADVERALAAGCDAFLPKPLTSAALLTGVRASLNDKDRLRARAPGAVVHASPADDSSW